MSYGHKLCVVFLKAGDFGTILLVMLFYPQQRDNESLEAFIDRLDDWDSKNHQIITWFRNTST